MNKLKHILFTLVAMAGFALSMSAQADDQKRPPKKPPVIDPGKKNNPPRENPPRENPPPRGENRPKKPY
jgi:hypothetical protein